MMKKKKMIILVTLILVVIFAFGFANTCFAAGIKDVDGLLKSSKLQKVSQKDSGANSSGIVKGINSISGLIQVAGSGIAIIVITLLGVKYILASPSDKADVKKSITPIIMGCIFLFGGVNIVGIIAAFSGDVLKTK